MQDVGESVLAGFTGETIKRRRFAPFYFLALVLTALLSVSIVLAYVASIPVLAYGIFYYATHGIEWLTGDGSSSRGMFWKLLFFYAIPLLGGLNILVLLVKPFLAKRVESVTRIQVPKCSEPLLEQFVERVAAVVGTKPPDSIELLCDANASAAFRGGWGGVFSGRMKLSIGLPLAAGMNVEMLGGVIAHEFGHFSQGMGMRLSFLIRSINGWLDFLVHGRDSWDEKLEKVSNEWANGNGAFVSLVIMGMQLCVWLVRKLVQLLSLLSHGVSCLTLRRMEYDADRYEAGFAGSDELRATVHRIGELNMGMRFAIQDCISFWQDRRLPKNFPRHVVFRAGSLKEEAREELRKHIEETRTGWFDTHPCDRDRILAAEKLAFPGVYACELPASVLFVDFEALCERATHNYYDVEQRLEVFVENLVDNEQFEMEGRAREEGSEAFRRVFGEGFSIHVPILLDREKVPLPAATPIAELCRRFLDTRGAVAGLLEFRAKAMEEIWEEDGNRLDLLRAEAILRAGLQLNSGLSLPQAQSKLALARQNFERVKEKAGPYRERARELIELTVNLLAREDFCPQDPAARAEAFKEAWYHVAVLDRLRTGYSRLLEYREMLSLVETMLGVHASLGDQAGNRFMVERTLGEKGREMAMARASIVRSFGDMGYPFPHARGEITIAQFLDGAGEHLPEGERGEAGSVETAVAEHQHALALFDAVGGLYVRVLERFSFFVEASTASVEWQARQGRVEAHAQAPVPQAVVPAEVPQAAVPVPA